MKPLAQIPPASSNRETNFRREELFSKSASNPFSNYTCALAVLFDELLAIAKLTSDVLTAVKEGFVYGQSGKCEAAIADAAEVADAEREVERLAVEIVAQFHPALADVRLLATAAKIAGSLRLIALCGASIAARARRLHTDLDAPVRPLFAEMFEQISMLLRSGINAFVTGGDESLRATKEGLGAAIHSEDKIFLHVTTAMSDSAHSESDHMDLILIARTLGQIDECVGRIVADAIGSCADESKPIH